MRKSQQQTPTLGTQREDPILGACLPSEVAEFSRRQLLRGGMYLTGYLSLERWLFRNTARADSASSYPVQRKLIWVNMGGGWDNLEIMDPHASSTAGIDMVYPYDQASKVAGASTDFRIGRWLPQMAKIGTDLIAIRGMAMGTTSHAAGPIYMDTGVLSNTGMVNSASIPAIVASESSATIPIIQLNGGANPQTDRGLLAPVSPVRAQNLPLYQSMYPTTDAEIQRRTAMLSYLNDSITRLKDETNADDTNDRILALQTSSTKVAEQFANNVGQKLSLSNSDISAFTSGAPQGMDQNMVQTFALAHKLLAADLCDCINLGIGGFDTHVNQSPSLQPLLGSVDFVIKRLVDNLRSAGLLDKTLIVMYSDFGRTPKVNAAKGRDHWPVGGAFLIGGGISGGRAVGGTDDTMNSLAIDPNTGFPSTSGIQINPTHLGGSVLALTLGQSYLTYRTYLSSLPALTTLKT